MCPGTALGFFWALGGAFDLAPRVASAELTPSPPAAAERRELYRFSADLGKLALRIADQYGSSFEKWYVPVWILPSCSAHPPPPVKA